MKSFCGLQAPLQVKEQLRVFQPHLQMGISGYALIKAFGLLCTQGKLEDRKPLMVLFGDVAMHYILSAAQ